MARGYDQDTLSEFRRRADDARFYENQTDTTVFEDPRFAHFIETGEYQPSSQAFPDNEISGANFGQGQAAATGRGYTQSQLDDIFDALMSANRGQGVDLSGLGPGAFPSFEVPGQELGSYIDDVLINQMEGFDPLGMEGRLRDLIERTTGGGFNGERLQNRIEAARENLTQGAQGPLADMRAMLADRGLISLPGSPEGAELDATMRVMEPFQRAYLSEIRNAEFDESVRADEAELDALTRATGWTADQARQRLAAADSAGGRQQMLSNIALGILDRNMSWNQYLADFGLRREQIEAEIERGNIEGIMPVLMLIMQSIQTARGGRV